MKFLWHFDRQNRKTWDLKGGDPQAIVSVGSLEQKNTRNYRLGGATESGDQSFHALELAGKLGIRSRETDVLNHPETVNKAFKMGLRLATSALATKT